MRESFKKCQEETNKTKQNKNAQFFLREQQSLSSNVSAGAASFEDFPLGVANKMVERESVN